MIRKLIPFLLVATLSACANTGTSSSSSRAPAASSSSSSSTSSDSSGGATYGGSSYGSSSNMPGSSTARILRPGQLVTMEYNATRLNLIVDDKDVMTAIRCG